jgi:hypothetical protein
MADRIPQTISDVDTRYCDVTASKLAEPAMMIGGEMTPASIARACWNPRSRARSTGMRSWRPKKGARRLDFLRNGRLGLKRKAVGITC